MIVEPVRTLLFISDLDGGGAQRTFVNLINALPRDRIAPTLVVARGNGPARNWLNTEFSLRNLERTRLRSSILPLRRAIHRDRPSVVLSTIADANVVAWLATRYLSTRLILRETNSHRARDDLSRLRKFLIAIAYRRADAVVALSEGVRSELIGDMGLNNMKTHTIHNPVDIQNITQLMNQGPERPIKKNGPIILGIGRLTRQKNFGLLIKSFAKQPNNESLLVILGEGPDRELLEALARNLGIAHRLFLPGFVSNIIPWLAHADLFVLSSLWEGYGHVLVEAMVAGVPVIATDCPHGPRDIIKHNDSGLLVTNNDEKALSRAIQELLDNRPRAGNLATTAQREAKSYASEIIAGQYADLIEQVAGK